MRSHSKTLNQQVKEMAPKPKASKSSSSSSVSAPFKRGSVVEVSSDDEGFRGSWFSGTVVRRIASDKFMVEYDNLMADEQSSKRLKEVISLHQLRPLPPAESHPEFKFGDEVDAFHNDGWWEGHITKDFGDGNFAVYFRVSREQIVFPKESLRIHREWINENWVPPIEQQQEQQQQDNGVQKEELTQNLNLVETVTEEEEFLVETVTEEEEFKVGTVVEVSSDEDGFQGAWFSATVVEAMGKEKFFIEYQSLLADDDSQLLREEADIHHIRPHPPETSVSGQFKLLDEVDAWYNDGWWVGVVSKVLDDSRYIVFFRNTNEELEFQGSQLRLHQDWIDGKWIMASKALKL
ncbi:protein AGENET DOMAIN (AGD)-CONTAINING P1 [Gastrolobium bilobum]|uniref:protein AGENET DOMAIN (AGD)-CONTAINING P1 n=1 Tax=Gastrolobium bilobum TaxID=150636 RepID=UPI002AB15A3F|nr:protein AGENET DOMAIN (AGD)-CONTAINING P1 [Gastrolobium bilobum]